MNEWEKPSKLDAAVELILAETANGPLSTIQLAELACDYGIKDQTLCRAKRKLIIEGRITIKRRGATTNPFTVRAVHPCPQPVRGQSRDSEGTGS